MKASDFAHGVGKDGKEFDELADFLGARSSSRKPPLAPAARSSLRLRAWRRADEQEPSQPPSFARRPQALLAA